MKRLALYATLPALAILSACNSQTTTTADTDNGSAMMMNGIDTNGADVVDIPGGEDMSDAGAANGMDAGSIMAGNAAAADSAPIKWSGHWVGVEGMVLDITPDASAGAGHYRLDMRWGLDPDMTGTFDGTLKDGKLHFTRSDGAQTLTPGDGDATGMKYLAGKKDCLIVKTGEGYCRD